MRELFVQSRQVALQTALKRQKREFTISHFQILEDLAAKKSIPEIYIELLTSLDSVEDRAVLARKFLRIYLYATSKIKGKKKLYDWLSRGTLPQTISQGNDKMSFLIQNAKRIGSLNKSLNKEIDKISKGQQRLSNKPNKRLEESIDKGKQKVGQLQNQFTSQRELIETIINEIETALASGRKL